MNALKNGSAAAAEDRRDVNDGEWDWNRWRQHFDEVDDQERLITILKVSPLHACNFLFLFLIMQMSFDL